MGITEGVSSGHKEFWGSRMVFGGNRLGPPMVGGGGLAGGDEGENFGESDGASFLGIDFGKGFGDAGHAGFGFGFGEFAVAIFVGLGEIGGHFGGFGGGESECGGEWGGGDEGE